MLGHFVHVYLDDIIITSSFFKGHLAHLEHVIMLLRNALLTLKEFKCHFDRTEIKYFGVKTTQSGKLWMMRKLFLFSQYLPLLMQSRLHVFLLCASYVKFIHSPFF